jgi:hypothetical protein
MNPRRYTILSKPFLLLAACLAAPLAPAGAQAQDLSQSQYDCLIEARQQVDVRSSSEGVIEKVFVGRRSRP